MSSNNHPAGTAGVLKAAVEDLLDSRRLSVEAAMARHFSPSFRQRTNGTWEDYAAVHQRITQLRANVDRMTFTVLDELLAGPRYAERHVIDLVVQDGGAVTLEVYVFAERDPDGRFLWIEEFSRDLGAG